MIVWLDLKSPGMCNGSAFLYKAIIRYCGLNLNIIATDKRPECLFDKLFCSVQLKAPRQHKHKLRHSQSSAAAQLSWTSSAGLFAFI